MRPIKVVGNRQRFNTPIEIGGVGMVLPNESGNGSVDKKTDIYLRERRGRKLEEAKQAELEHVTEEEKTEAARQRKERELIEGGQVSPMGNKEVDMVTNEKKISDAAEVAAEAASAGVKPEDAKDLGTGSKKVVVIKPVDEVAKGEGGWSVVDGKPVKDPEGEYTFGQAHKVAALDAAKRSDDPLALFKFLKEEGFMGGKGDDFMTTFMAELARKSVDNLVHPPQSNPSGSSTDVTSLKDELRELREEVKRSSDPVAAARRVKDMFDTFKTLGLVPEASGGTGLEEIRETHRHEEKMGEVNADREYKKNITEIASEIPERIGRGIASQFTEEGEGSSGAGLEYMICTEEGCGTKIYITPETGNQVTCAKCGTIYTRGKTVEGEKE